MWQEDILSFTLPGTGRREKGAVHKVQEPTRSAACNRLVIFFAAVCNSFFLIFFKRFLITLIRNGIVSKSLKMRV